MRQTPVQLIASAIHAASYEVPMAKLSPEDKDRLNAMAKAAAHAVCGPTEAEAKYSPAGGGEHPSCPRAEWRKAVQDKLTIVGYWEWVEHQFLEGQNHDC